MVKVINLLALLVISMGILSATHKYVRWFFHIMLVRKKLANKSPLDRKLYLARVGIESRQRIKVYLGSYILLSLELLIAADIVETLIGNDMQTMMRLLFIVGIRTAIAFFLNKEIIEDKHELGDHLFLDEIEE